MTRRAVFAGCRDRAVEQGGQRFRQRVPFRI